MTSPFDPPPALPVVPLVQHPIAIVADSQEQVDAYLAASRPPGPWAIVFNVDDVPEQIGGMAILREGGTPKPLQDALMKALGVTEAGGA